jgi:hypothetical protein
MTVKSIRILIEFTWPSAVVDRVWDGSGPFVDSTGEIWQGCSLAEGFDDIEQVINGEAYVLNMALMNVGAEAAALHWLSLTSGQIVGGVVRVLIQPCDADDQPVGASEVMFTGRVDNVIFDDVIANSRPVSRITAEVANRFNLRRLKHGAVLSDTDQRARSLAINPTEDPDRFCERVPLLQDKTIVWPRWNS